MGKEEQNVAPPAAFGRYQAELQTELVSAIGKDPLHFYTIMSYHLGWVDSQGNPQQASPGKRLRPTLCLLSCEAVQGDWHKALPAAAALELVHNFTLIHDDVQDKSRQRRHRPTVWSLWGIAQAINVGDGMWAAAQKGLLRLQDNGVPHDRVVRASWLLSQACLVLCEGQYLDVSFESCSDIDVDNYIRMIDAKTAQLFSCSITLGALVGTKDEEVISRLSVFGRKLGLAFQVQDDLLGIWGREKTTGKSANTDIREKKKTLPVICALKHAKGVNRERLLTLYQREKRRLNLREIAEVVEILDSAGARAESEEFLHRYYSEALAELQKVGLPSRWEQELREMAAFIMSQS